jgi:hypothetical protein
MQALNHCQRDRTALVTLVYSLALLSLIWSDLAQSIRPLAASLLIVPLLGAWVLATAFRLRHWHHRIAPLVEQGLDRRQFAAVARQLDWRPIRPRTKERWLEGVVNEPP